MARQRFWRGFAVGAAVGAGGLAGGLALAEGLAGGRARRILRLEKSLQVGRPVEEVFRAWRELQRLPEISPAVDQVQTEGNRSHWTVRMNGRTVRWTSEIEQVIPNQAIGWKSVTGPKHTGRITFSPIGNDTLLQVTMNYAPPLGVLRAFTQPLEGHLQAFLDQVLRDFKASLEGKGQEGRSAANRGESRRKSPGIEISQAESARSTGTYGAENLPSEPVGR